MSALVLLSITQLAQPAGRFPELRVYDPSLNIATGFWNPFALDFDRAGHLFCGDNDPMAVRLAACCMWKGWKTP